MSNRDIFPKKKNDLSGWVEQFASVAQANAASWGLDLGEVSDAVSSAANFRLAIQAKEEADGIAAAAAVSQRQAKRDIESKVRRLTRQIRGKPGISDADHATLGLPIRDRKPTKTVLPNSRPIGRIDTGQRLIHILRIVDADSPNTRSKPPGTMGCEVWRSIGPTPPVDNKDALFIGLSTKSRFEVPFEGEHAGQTAHYLLRWLNTRGEPGPWSEVVSATIVG